MITESLIGLSPRRFFKELVPLLVLMLVVDGSFAYLFLVVLQNYIPNEPGGSVSLTGYAIAAFGATKLLLQVGTGALSDRIGRRPAVILGVAIEACAVLMLLAFRKPILVIPFGALYGFGNATIWPALHSEVVGRFNSDVRGRIASIMLIAITAAIPFGIGVGALVVDDVGFRTALAGAFVPLALALLLTLTWGKPAKRTEDGSQVSPTFRELRTVLGDRRRLVFAVLVVAYTCGGGSLIPTFHPYATEHLGLSLRTFVIVLAPAGIAGALATILGGFVSDRIGRFPLLTSGLGLVVFGLLLLLTTRDPWRVAAYATIPATGMALTIPAIGASLWDLAGERYRGAILGFFMTAEGIGQSFGPAIGGYITEASGPMQTFRISAALFAVAFAVGLALWIVMSRQTPRYLAPSET